MSTQEIDMQRFPFTDHPTGWYVVGRSGELAPGAILGVKYFGEDIALFRTEDGVAHATGAYCPHLGAYLPEGGQVHGDRIRCRFHGFEFDGRGRCAKVSYGSPAPPRARLKVWPLREMAGLLVVWFDALGRPPEWEIDAPDTAGWTDLRMRKLELRSHPQETSENSVDFGHFSELHGFQNPTVLEKTRVDGPLLTGAYEVRMQGAPRIADRVLGLFGKASAGMTIRFRVRVQGLGWSLVEGTVPVLGMRFRQFVLATPIDRDRIHLRVGSSVARRAPGLDRALLEVAFRGLMTEVERDRPIWETKRYLSRPALAKGDGPIGLYRKWCQQFYPARPAADAVDDRVRLPLAS